MSELTTLARGDGSHIIETRRAIVRTAAEWRALWAEHAGPGAAAPDVDFDRSIVAAAFAGERPTPGFQIAIEPSPANGRTPILRVVERRPPSGALAAQVIVTPFHIVAMPRTVGEPEFEGLLVTGSAGASRSLAADAAASTTGLAPHVAAALAYLAGPFSAVVILAAERTSPYVKFHAWQSIVGLGGMGLLAATLLISAFLTLFISPAAFTTLYWAAAVAAVASAALLVAYVWQAFTGRVWKLPLVGEWAARRARR